MVYFWGTQLDFAQPSSSTTPPPGMVLNVQLVAAANIKSATQIFLETGQTSKHLLCTLRPEGGQDQMKLDLVFPSNQSIRLSAQPTDHTHGCAALFRIYFSGYFQPGPDANPETLTPVNTPGTEIVNLPKPSRTEKETLPLVKSSPDQETLPLVKEPVSEPHGKRPASSSGGSPQVSKKIKESVTTWNQVGVVLTLV